MTTEIKQTYLDKLAIKPVPKHDHQFFVVPETAKIPIEDEPANLEEMPAATEDWSVIVVDKRESMIVDCEGVWSKINRRVGSVFDKRKVKKTDERERERERVSDRFVSDHLETALGKRLTETAATREKEKAESEFIITEEPYETEEPTTEREPAKTDVPDIDVEDLPNLEDIVLPEPVVKATRARKTTAKELAIQKHNEDIAKTTIDENTMLNGKRLLPRLPKPEKFVIRAPTYYMSNRKLYAQKLNELFKDYNKEIAAEVSNASCDSQSSDNIQMLIHQRIVRDYLNLYTPYRGLLLYHGLGSGKTCTSIAIAEGMKSRRKVFVMTPASLKMNFFSEMKKCGDALYKKKQYWEFISTKGQPQNIPILAKALSLPVEFILKYNGAWLMDTTKPTPNFADLSSDNQKILDEQLNAMIRTKYVDINYNGLNENRLDKLFERDSDGNEINPFHHSVVLIDEAHNFMSRVSNKLNAHKSIAYRLYDKLLRADNVRIVLMTGTPMINYPNELGILFNLLRGVIRTWTFTISGNQKLVKDTIVEMFDNAGFKTYDYIDYANGKLTITRNPFGFINASKVRKGGFMPEFTSTITEVDVVGGGEPDNTSDDETTEDGSTTHNDEVKNTPASKLRKHIRLRKTIKTPPLKKIYDKIHDEHCPEPNDTTKQRKRTTEKRHAKTTKPANDKKDSSSQSEYTPVSTSLPKASTRDNENLESKGELGDEALSEEIRKYTNSLYDAHNGGNGSFEQDGGDQIVNPDYHGVYLNEQGNISDEMFVEQVKRILQKNGVAITGKETATEYKALPETPTEFLQMFVEDNKLVVKNINLFKKRILGLTSYFRSAQEKLLPRFVPDADGNIYHMVKVEMSDHQLATYFRFRTEEIQSEKNMKIIMQNAKELYKTASSYRIFSRVACNFVFPEELPRPRPSKKNMTEEDIDNIADGNQEDMYVDENAAAPILDRSYQEAIVSALNTIGDYTNKYLTPESLKQYSPKFLRVLENIRNPDHRGLHLVYSNFRSLEGIGIFKLVLEHNGYAEFKLQRNGDMWEIKDTDPDKTKPRFVLYTGTETSEEKELIRNIYNSQWDLVPPAISAALRETAENNYYGEVIRIIMITASGAEGINLANTRYVHIMEPYWNMVRVDQVVGRARRICSHKNLPEELRSVQVFLYVSTFNETQRKDPKYRDIMVRDEGRLTKVAVTTDENLYDIAIMKNRINEQLLKGIKETAIDCRLYKKGNAETNLVCYGEGVLSRTNEFGVFPSLDEDKIVREDINIRKVARKMKKIRVQRKGMPDMVYAQYRNNLYDWEAYENSGQEILVAKKEGNRIVYVNK